MLLALAALSSSPPSLLALSASPSPPLLLAQLLEGTSAHVLTGNATLACASLTLSAVAPPLTLWLPNGTTAHTFTVLAAPAVAPPPLPSLLERAAHLLSLLGLTAFPSPLLAFSLPHDKFEHHTSGVDFTFLITSPSVRISDFKSRITDNDFERTLASCCGHSISLLFNAPAKRGRFIASGRCHATASFLCFDTASFLCFGQEGLHPTSSTVSLLCHSQEGLHLTSTSGNFSQTPLKSEQGTAVCSLPSASGHHNPVTFCNLLRFLSTITDSFTSLGYIALDSTTTNGFCMPATAFDALPCTTACISLFAFAILLLVSISVFSCAVYALRTRFSMLGANINCCNSVYNNVPFSNVGVFDFFKSVPWENRVLYRSTDRYQLPWPFCSDLRRRLCLFSHLAVSIRL